MCIFAAKSKDWNCISTTLNDPLPRKNTDGFRLYLRTWRRRVLRVADAQRLSRTGYEAKDWLMEHGFPHLAAIDSVIDKEAKAEEWLVKNHFTVNLAFAKAINRDDDATDWLEKNEFQVFIVLADKIRKYLDDKYLDYHKIHF